MKAAVDEKVLVSANPLVLAVNRAVTATMVTTAFKTLILVCMLVIDSENPSPDSSRVLAVPLIFTILSVRVKLCVASPLIRPINLLRTPEITKLSDIAIILVVVLDMEASKPNEWLRKRLNPPFNTYVRLENATESAKTRVFEAILRVFESMETVSENTLFRPL